MPSLSSVLVKIGFCKDCILPSDRYFETGQIGSFEKRDEANQRTTCPKNSCHLQESETHLEAKFGKKSFGRIQHQLQRISFWQKVFINFASRHNLSPHQIAGINVVLRFENEKRKCLGQQVLLQRYSESTSVALFR